MFQEKLATGDLVQLGTFGALAFSVVTPLVTVLLFATSPPIAHSFPEAAAVTALYLSLHLRHVRYRLRGARPPGLWWSLPAMTVIIVAASPLLGWSWFYAYNALGASVLVTLRPRLSFPAFGCLLIGLVVWGLNAHVGLAGAVYAAVAVVDRSAVVFVLVWLVGALRRADSARQALADTALEAERRRIDDELSQTVGTALEAVLQNARAAEASVLAQADASAELHSLVDYSRSALADVRRLIGRYQRTSPRAELERAASILRVAGIQARVELPAPGNSLILDDALRASLRAEIADLLAEEQAVSVVLRLISDGDGIRFELDRVSGKTLG